MGRYSQRQRRGGGPGPAAPAPPAPAAVDFVTPDGTTAGDVQWWWTEDVVVSSGNVPGLEADDGGGLVVPDSVTQLGPRLVMARYTGHTFTAGGAWNLPGDPSPDLTSAGGITAPASGTMV